MLITVLFTIGKIWKQLKCLIDDWIKKRWYIYAKYYSAVKKSYCLQQCGWA